MIALLACSSALLSPVSSRRAVIAGAAGFTLTGLPHTSLAALDCMDECKSSCNKVAPNSGGYCQTSCDEYCSQDDRRDGLSGSVTSQVASDVGFASALDPGTFNPAYAKKGVVVDRPPGLPDVFNLGPALRKAVAGSSANDGGGVMGAGGARDFSDQDGPGLPFRAK